MGSRLIAFAEEFAKQRKMGKILLSSLDTPIGFYASKGFTPVKGKEFFEVPDNVRLSLIKRDGSLLPKEFLEHGLSVDKFGMTTKFNNALRLLTKTNNSQPTRMSERHLKGRKILGKNSKIGALQGVKIDDGMLVMEKVIMSNNNTAGSKVGMGSLRKKKKSSYKKRKGLKSRKKRKKKKKKKKKKRNKRTEKKKKKKKKK